MLSKATLEKVGDKEKFCYRYLGKVRVKGKDEVLGLYEIFDEDEAHIKQRKNETLENFNTGLKAYFDKNFTEAAVLFKKVLDVNPEDKTAIRYFQNAAKFMVESPPVDWDGVEKMHQK